MLHFENLCYDLIADRLLLIFQFAAFVLALNGNDGNVAKVKRVT